ncbi:MAG: hypothetical protein HY320_12355 [Armatimonadetes bacterium]|nr:hypothetical protein [Armatimonadota bacterium]
MFSVRVRGAVLAAVSVSVFVLLSAGCSASPDGTTRRARNDRPRRVKQRLVDEAFQKLASGPQRARTGPGSVDTLKAVENLIRDLAKYDVDVLREVVKRVEAAPIDQRITLEDNILVLNRYIFNVPADAQIFHAYLARLDARDALWPWVVEKGGDLRLAYTPSVYSGPPPEILMEFDYYRKEYGIRKIKSNNP